MSSTVVLVHCEKPEEYRLLVDGDVVLTIARNFIELNLVGVDPRLVVIKTRLLIFDGQKLSLVLCPDEEQMIPIVLASVQNCAQVHQWVVHANRLLHRQA